MATNASGAKSFKYGATRNFISSLEIMLPTGEFITISRGEQFAIDDKLTIKTNTNRSIELELPEIHIPITKNAAGFFCKKIWTR